MKPFATRFWSKVLKAGPDECWLWLPPVGNHGYGQISRGPAGAGMVTAHRASYELAFGPIPVGMCVLHRCDNKRCVNPAHFFLGTLADNIADMMAKGRQASPEKTRHCGESHGRAKLSAADVTYIRSISDVSDKFFGLWFGVHPETIARARRWENWKELS